MEMWDGTERDGTRCVEGRNETERDGRVAKRVAGRRAGEMT